ncbi:phage major capsid protein [Spiribacter halobius]|uniref:Phage major capsid protein n=1 Tax=Sediminicurvatus halobius TaxID=2182432 RepID=A0A2U2MZU7_9GAMM|nr:hypothetical protein [Spiribacter halobius]PWG62328.1 hypothetical protein DEM34_12705 [Spiribacter halobius]UEX79750.1 hypothetical protein LMH63_08920 [Spiribacter halobius]
MLEATANTRDFTVSDIRDAGADLFAKAMGARTTNSHPVAEQLRNRELSLAEAAYILGEPEVKRRGASGKTAGQVVGIGLTTDDFGSVMESAVGRVVSQAYLAASEHRNLVLPWPVPNYQPAQVATIDVDADTGEIGELEEIPSVQVSVPPGHTGSVESYAANLIVSYKLVVNDQLDVIATTARAIAVSAARREARRLYEFLEGNPEMGDGAAMFSSGAGNLVTGVSGVTAANLGTAMAALRNQKTPGDQYANHRVQTLIVPPAEEQPTYQALRETGIEGVSVIAAPWVASSNWYAMAAPDVAPTVAMMYLAPRGDTAMRTVRTYRRPGDRLNRRTGVEIAHDFGYAPVSRVGIVKLTN